MVKYNTSLSQKSWTDQEIGTYLNIIKAIYSKPTVTIIKWRETRSNTTKISDDTRLPTPSM